MRHILMSITLVGFVATTSAAQDVPIPCDPVTCPPIDPCKLAPERCNPPGGPIPPEPEPKPDPKPDPEPQIPPDKQPEPDQVATNPGRF